MLKNMFRKVFANKELSENLVPPDEEATAKVLSKKVQDNATALKPKKETVLIMTDRNKWSIAALILLIVSLIMAIGWYRASERFATHVRIAFVKLDPSGNTSVSLYDENSQPTYYMNTIYSLLSNYVERRYSKVPFSIRSDYGFVLNFMSPQLKNDFLNTYQAAKVAADFENCKSCQQIRLSVRTIQHDESDETMMNGKPGAIYRSTVFAESTEVNPDGSLVSKANQIITLTWRIKSVESLSDHNLDAIQANPIGIEILADPIKQDPTPVAIN